MRAAIASALVAALLAGCAADDATPTPPASPTPSATPASPPPASPTPMVPTAPVVPTISPEPEAPPEPEDVATADDYVAPVFLAQDEVALAADPASFADVNPIDYRNPWRS